ncbi:MAG: hypothetical protein LBI59_02935 [Candidatus Accumulibacter sp.]|nr:hypothetical protein [Accumulibacter sp.]
MICAFLAIAPVSVPAAEALGRLFFTPERRQALDWQRLSGGASENDEEISVEEAPVLSVDGVVTRSSGRHTVWINGATWDDALPGGVSIVPERENPGQVIVRSEDGPDVRAKVGNVIDRSSGETADLLGGGRIHRVRRDE